MAYLILVSLVWAASFGLIKTQLAGLDANWVAWARLLLALLLFLPWWRPRRVPARLAVQLCLTGAVQFGLMYVAYLNAFHYLQAHQVALFTIFTPYYVTALHDACERRFHPEFLLPVSLAVLGTGVLVYRQVRLADFGAGFLLVQAANLCFAAGQVAYPRLMRQAPAARDADVFAYLYAGAAAASGLAAGWFTDWQALEVSPAQLWVLLYLGVIASGVSFFLWNLGARQANPGTLAICNNLKIPLAILCSLLFFHETIPIGKLALGGGLILFSLAFNEWQVRRAR